MIASKKNMELVSSTVLNQFGNRQIVQLFYIGIEKKSAQVLYQFFFNITHWHFFTITK